MKTITLTNACGWRPSVNCKLAAVMALLLALGSLLAAQAQDIISFNISAGTTTDRNFMFPADLAGAPGVRTNNWNDIGNYINGGTGSADATLSAGSVVDSSGTIVPNIQATLHYGGNGGDGYSDRTAGNTNDGKMFYDVADNYGTSSFGGYGYINISNIPFTNYEVYVYFLPDTGNGSGNTRGGVFCITNTPSGATNCIYMQNQSNDVAQTQITDPSTSTFATAYVQATTTAIAPGANTWSSIKGANFGVFSGLTNSQCTIFYSALGNGSGSGSTGGEDPFGNYVTGGSTAVRFKVSGFQVFQIPAAAPTNLYLLNTSLILHAGSPSGIQTTVLANLNNGTIGLAETAYCTFSVDNTSVATVSASGLITQVTNGTANLIVTLPGTGLSLTNPISVIGPTSLSISLANTNLLRGNGQGDVTTATLYAIFSDAPTVPVAVNSFNFVSFSATPGVVSITSNGTITAMGVGTFSVTGNYDGMSVTTNNVGVVSAYVAPVGGQAFSVKLTDATHDMTFHDLSGAPGARVAYWNNLAQSFGNVTNELASLWDDQGNVLSGTVVEQILTSEPQAAVTVSGTPTTNESVLFDSYTDQGDSSGTTLLSTLIVSNIPYSSYDVYFYVYNDNSTSGTNRPGEFTIDGVTQYRINSLAPTPTQPDNTGNGYVQATPQPVGLPASVVDVPFGNMVKFTSITDNVLTVTYGAVGQDYIGDAASVTRMRIVGFEVVKSLDGLTATNVYLTPAAVPAQLAGNPATYSLTVLANFTDGTMGGNIDGLPGLSFSTSNTNVFGVDTNGIVYPGLTPGVATLTVSYQTNVLHVSVTNLAPTSVSVVAMPKTVYIDGTLGIQPAQAEVLATYPGDTNVNISGFNGVTFVDQGSSVATLASGGTITVNSSGLQGYVNLGASYLGANWVTPNAFMVSSITNPPALAHLYTFTDAANSTTIKDSIGGANGVIYPPLGTNQPIKLDGSHVIFPGDGAYTNEPYINLPQYLIANNMGDVTIEMWGGISQRLTWGRFLGFGNTPKGTSPYIYGGTASTNSIQSISDIAPTGAYELDCLGAYVGNGYTLTAGAEYHIVDVIAPNAGIEAVYINGVLETNVATETGQFLSAVEDQDDWLGVSLSNDDPPLAGWMNRLAIYEGVMTASQVSSNYAAGVSIYLPPGTNPVSTNALLAGLTLSPALSFTPSFSSNTLSGYTATEGYQQSFTVTVTDADPTATNTLTYNGNNLGLLPSGTASSALSLNLNPGYINTLSVLVTAQDGVTTQTYTVNVAELPSTTRPQLSHTLSASALTFNWPLANLGYRLLEQTNNLSKGVSTNPNDWMTIPGSTATNALTEPIIKTNLDEYFQLVYP